MSRNLVIYSDGTGQDGGVRPDQRMSNVYKMYRATRVGPDTSIDPSEQVAFYDPGLGTDADVHGWGRVRHVLGKFLASVAGRGIATNIADCYEFVLNHWRPGDRIFIVGFSRGAYTARCVAQVLSLCGVPRHEPNDPSKPFRRFSRSTRKVAERAVHEVYEHGAGHPRGEFEGERDELARRFRVEFGSDEEGLPNAHPHFVGVFDTVAALGAKGLKRWGLVAVLSTLAALPLLVLAVLLRMTVGWSLPWTFVVLAIVSALVVWLRLRADAVRFIDDWPTPGSSRLSHRIAWHAANYDRGLSGHVGYARQASAIDEDRADFPRVPWGRNTVVRAREGDEPPPLVQLWFPGNHSDIGGSYEEVESRLSDVALEWMVDEATGIPGPLIVDRRRLSIWPDPEGLQHSEVQAVLDRRLWWLPKRAPSWMRGWEPAVRQAKGSPVHPSVHARFEAGPVQSATGFAPYRPAALADDDRFRRFYAGALLGASAALAALEGMSIRAPVNTESDPRASAQAERGTNPETDAVLASQREDPLRIDGVVVVASDGIDADRDDYRDALSLCQLQRLVARRGGQAEPVVVQRGDQPEVFPALLISGVEDAFAAARTIGARAVLAVEADGSLRPVPTV